MRAAAACEHAALSHLTITPFSVDNLPRPLSRPCASANEVTVSSRAFDVQNRWTGTSDVSADYTSVCKVRLAC